MLDRVRADDGVELVLLRSTLLEMPRAAAARGLGERIHRAAPKAEIIPYAWHLVTHAHDDALGQRGTRTLPGEAHHFGHLADTPQVEEAWAATTRAAEALGADTVVLRTPPSFAPGARGRRRLETFVDRRRQEGRRLVWEPEGLWEPDELSLLARQLDITLLTPPPAEGRIVLERRWLLPGSGGSAADLRGSAADSLLYDVLNEASDGSITVVFAGGLALKNLRAFRRAFEEALS